MEKNCRLGGEKVAGRTSPLIKGKRGRERERDKRISTVFMDTYAVFILLDILASYVIMNTPFAKPMHGK